MLYLYAARWGVPKAKENLIRLGVRPPTEDLKDPQIKYSQRRYAVFAVNEMFSDLIESKPYSSGKYNVQGTIYCANLPGPETVILAYEATIKRKILRKMPWFQLQIILFLINLPFGSQMSILSQ